MIKELAYSAYGFVERHESESLATVAALVLVYHLLVYPFLISPFRHFPGPYLFRVSRLPSLHYQRTNQWVGLVHELHKRYGDVVVLSPGEISVNGDPQYLRDIYTRNMPKSKFYENFRNHGFKDNMFSSLENDRHIGYKKNITSIYSKSAVFSAKNSTRKTIVEKVSKLCAQIRASSVDGTAPDYINAASEVNIHGKGHHEADKKWFLKGKPALKNLGIDVYSLFGALALDVVTAFELGPQNGTDLLDCPDKRAIITYHRYVALMVFYTTLMPTFWDMAASGLIKRLAAAVERWQLGIYGAAEANVPQFKDGENWTTLELLKKNKLVGEYAYSFLSDNIFAGHETTAIQLTYLTYELSRPGNLGLQDSLRAELVAAFGMAAKNQTIENFEIVDSLPLLNAIILETSRVHASIPGAEPRVVDRPYKVAGVTVPVNSVISVQPFLMHRVERVFPEPDHFVPQRWLRGEDETEVAYAARMTLQHKYMMPFGKGVRMCLGMNIAQIEMKVAVANIYWHFSSRVCANWCQVTESSDKLPAPLGMGRGGGRTDEDKMAMYDTYTTRPWDDECWIEFYESAA